MAHSLVARRSYANTGAANSGAHAVSLSLTLGPSQFGQPKLAPATPSLISSHAPSPTSLMKIRPEPGCTAKVNGLRRPSAQMARFTPVAVPKNGLSDGMVPSALSRRTLPRRVSRLWELAPTPLSPTAT